MDYYSLLRTTGSVALLMPDIGCGRRKKYRYRYRLSQQPRLAKMAATKSREKPRWPEVQCGARSQARFSVSSASRSITQKVPMAFPQIVRENVFVGRPAIFSDSEISFCRKIRQLSEVWEPCKIKKCAHFFKYVRL